MNDLILFTGIAGVVLLGLFAFASYHIYRGVRGNITNAKVGEVYNFEYLQPHHGDPVRFLARVIEPVYTLSEDRIRRLNATSRYRYNDPEFKRTKHLVTCEMPNGAVRNFYAERIVNCHKPLLGGTLFKVGVAHLF